jgi:hypothetical protein
MYLFYGLMIAFTLELLDTIHRTYEAEESIDIIQALMHGKMFASVVVVQAIIGSLVPLVVLGTLQVVRLPDNWRTLLSAEMAILVLIGVFTMRWNVVIGGQLFSKSLRGFTIYRLDAMGREGLLTTIGICVLPLAIFALLAWILPPWQDPERDESEDHARRAGGTGRPTRARAVLATILALSPVIGPLVLVVERIGEGPRHELAEIGEPDVIGPGMWIPHDVRPPPATPEHGEAGDTEAESEAGDQEPVEESEPAGDSGGH